MEPRAIDRLPALLVSGFLIVSVYLLMEASAPPAMDAGLSELPSGVAACAGDRPAFPAPPNANTGADQATRWDVRRLGEMFLGTRGTITDAPSATCWYELPGAGADGRVAEVVLAGRRLGVRTIGQEKPFWESDATWKVEQCAVLDVDGDGRAEIVISFWKRGSFGSSRPFWHTGEDDRHTNHLSVLNCRAGRVRMRWGSSAIANPILDLDVAEASFCNRVVPALKIRDRSGVGLWVWDEWGFTRISDAPERSSGDQPSPGDR